MCPFRTTGSTAGRCIRPTSEGVVQLVIAHSRVAQSNAATSPFSRVQDGTRTLVRGPEGVRLLRAQVLRRPREDVSAFFENPENLEDITPPYLRFRIVSPRPVAMQSGTVIDYRLRLFGLPIAWRTRIASYDRGRSFVDMQQRGPFATWIHRHEFHDHPLGTLMTDQVDFRSPLGLLGRAAEAIFVERLVTRIFDFRRDRITALVEGTAKR